MENTMEDAGKRFRASDGSVHFLFANEDHYYLDSLVCLGLYPYIEYSLKRAGYRGVYFVQDLNRGYLVRTGDRFSADAYPRSGGNSILPWLRTELPVEREKLHGSEVYTIRHGNLNDMNERLCQLLGNPDRRCAVVFSIETFSQMYREPAMQESLFRVFSAMCGSNMILLTASLDAEKSVRCLTNRDGVFNSKLFPQLQQILQKDRRTLLYEEMRTALGERYNVWGQMSMRDIRRMLRYLMLIDGIMSDRMARLGDYAALIYAWYHSEEFARSHAGLFADSESRQLSPVAVQLRSARAWERMDAEIAELRVNQKSTEALYSILGRQYTFCRFWDPMLLHSTGLQRLHGVMGRQRISGGSPVRIRQILCKEEEIEKVLRSPYSDAADPAEGTELDYGVDLLTELQKAGCFGANVVDRVLTVIKYSVCSSERYRRSSVYLKKTGYYKNTAELAFEIARMENEVRSHEERLNECEAQFDRLRMEIRKKETENIGYRKEVERLLAGSSSDGISPEVLMLNTDKAKLVRLDQERRNLGRIIANKKNKINMYYTSISQIEMTIDGLSEPDLNIEGTLDGVSADLQRQAAEEARLMRRLNDQNETNQLIQEEGSRMVSKEMESAKVDVEFARIMEELDREISENLSGGDEECLLVE
ncbi:MAG: hypothetical protein LUC98_01860 [Lachnospiraceae bacterium]|nr:hypothetical protein [Lachnospiraceae bacterium]